MLDHDPGNICPPHIVHEHQVRIKQTRNPLNLVLSCGCKSRDVEHYRRRISTGRDCPKLAILAQHAHNDLVNLPLGLGAQGEATNSRLVGSWRTAASSAQPRRCDWLPSIGCEVRPRARDLHAHCLIGKVSVTASGHRPFSHPHYFRLKSTSDFLTCHTKTWLLRQKFLVSDMCQVDRGRLARITSCIQRGEILLKADLAVGIRCEFGYGSGRRRGIEG